MKLTFERAVLICAILWYVLTAVQSTGYYHGDEQYQIIEFAYQKQQGFGSDKLAWEYSSRIRPAIQPAIGYAIMEVCQFVSITDPYDQAFVLRLITALLAVFSIYFFTSSCRKFIADKYWKAFFILSFFTWFLPFIKVRFSSEAWSGLFLLLSIGLVIRNRTSTLNYILLGFLLGLSFVFRFQTGIAILGVFLWLWFIRKERIPLMLSALFSCVIVVMLGSIVDYWFYNEWVLTPWNYLSANILQDVASEFGTSPWYYYIYYIFRFSFFPFGILILASLAYICAKKPVNILVWTILPFLLVHSIIPHKELRFIFPLVNFVPVVFFLAIQKLELHNLSITVRRILKILASILLFMNLTGLIVASLKPAGTGRMQMTKSIHDLQNRESISLLTYKGSNPYDPWGGLNAQFYLDSNIDFRKLKKLKELETLSLPENRNTFLILKKKHLEETPVRNFIAENNFIKLTESMPHQFQPVLQIYGGFSMSDILVLYGQKTTKSPEW